MRKEVVFFLLVSVLTILAVSSISASSIPVYVKPLAANGSLNPDTTYSYVFNWTTNSSCTNVVFSNSLSITTGEDGVGYANLTIPDNMSSIPSYLCEYRDGTLKAIIQLSGEIFDKIYAQTVNATSVYSSGNITAAHFYQNGSPLVSNSSLGNYYPNSNPNGYYNSTTLPSSTVGNPFNQTLNTTSNVTFANVNATGNVTGSTGFFSYLGSLANKIVNLFVQNIFANNINASGQINASEFYQNGSPVALNSSLNNYYLKSNPTGYINWSQAINGTLALNSSLANYYPMSNPYGYLNSSSLPSSGILGGGTYSYVPMFNATNSITNSIIYQNGSNVGIGTTNPSYKLDVNGTINAENVLVNGTAISSSGGALSGGSTNYVPLWNSSSTLGNSIIYQNGSNVGIGTTSPSYNLDIDGSLGVSNSGILYLASSGTNNGLMKQISVSGINYIESALNLTTGSAADLRFTNMNDANTWMTIKSNGYVGIGTTNPGSTLDVNGSLTLANSGIAGPSTSGNGIYIKNAAGTSELTLYRASGDAVRLSDNGGTGIYMDLYQPSDSFSVYNATNGASLFYLQNTNGFVGIGTTSPSYKLDVSGNIRSTGTIYANANGAAYFCGGDDTCLHDINVANTMGLYGVENSTLGSIKLGSSGGTISGYNGNIGIGTTSPTKNLVIEGTSQSANTGIETVGTDNHQIFILPSDGSGGYNPLVTAGDGAIIFSNGTINNGNLIIAPWSNSSVGIKLLANGYVGIGTTSPGELLDINGGDVRTTGEFIGTLGTGYGQFRAISGNYGTFIRNDGTDTYFLATASGDQYGSWSSIRPFYFSDSSGLVTMSNGQTLGGGTTVTGTLTSTASTSLQMNNAATFQAKNSAGTYETFLWPRYSDNVMYLNYGSAGFNIRNDNSVSTIFMTSGNEVGIGTTSPNQALTVNGNVNITGKYYGIGGSYSQYYIKVSTTTCASGWTIVHSGTSCLYDWTQSLALTGTIMCAEPGSTLCAYGTSSSTIYSFGSGIEWTTACNAGTTWVFCAK